MAANPYTLPADHAGRSPLHATGVFSGNVRYAVKTPPDSTDPEYTNGYSPALVSGGSSNGEGLPDNVRIGTRKPPVWGGTWNKPSWANKRHAEQNERYKDDHLEEMWKIRQQRVAPPNVPLWNQERPPTRPTATNSPTGYAFERYWYVPRNATTIWGDDDPKAINGASRKHFSLADHRRKYEIYTMKPQGGMGVNTYRAEPRPWDEQLFIQPPAEAKTPGFVPGNRSYRL